MLLLANENPLEQRAAAIVTRVRARGDAAVEPLDRGALEVERELQLLRDSLADPHACEPLEIGNAFEKGDALDELVSVLHHRDGSVP